MSISQLSKEELLNLIQESTNNINDIRASKAQIDQLFKDLFHDEGENKKALKSRLEDLETKISSSKIEVDKQYAAIKEYYNHLFEDKESDISITRKIESFLSQIETHQRAIQQKNDLLTASYNFLVVDSESQKSVKTQIEAANAEVSQHRLNIANYQKELLEDTEDRKSIKTSVDIVKRNVDAIHSEANQHTQLIKEYAEELLTDNPEKPSIKKKVDVLLSEIEAHKKSIQQKNDLLTTIYNTLIIDSEQPSVKTQLTKTNEDFSNAFKDAQIKLGELKTFHNAVFGEDKNESPNSTPGLKETVFALKEQLEKLTKEANQKLQALTDQALHNSFATRAAKHTEDYTELQRKTLRSLVGIVLVTLAFGLVQLINTLWISKEFNYHLVYYQLGISLPLIFIAWMYNRNQKIAKKLAEEYHHKASLAEAMTGYRNLYSLKHDDKEYMALFDKIKDQLNVNPSNKIDKFLSLKSPQEKIIDRIGDLSPDELKTYLENFIKARG